MTSPVLNLISLLLSYSSPRAVSVVSGGRGDNGGEEDGGGSGYDG